MTNIENILNNKYVDKGSYKVPDNYFCQLQNRITERIKQESGTSDSTAVPANVPKKKFFLLTPRFRYAVAACFIGAAVLTAVGLSHYNKEKNIVIECNSGAGVSGISNMLGKNFFNIMFEKITEKDLG